MNRPKIARPVRIVVLIAATGLLGAVTWYSFANKLPPGRSLLLSVGSLALLWVLLRIGILEAPSGFTALTFGQNPRLRDVLWSVACIAGGFAWLVLFTRRVSDTEAGAALLGIPFILLVAGGTFFLIRGLFFPGRKG